MSDDNDNVISFASKQPVKIETPKLLPGDFEFHVMNPGGTEEETCVVQGYLKFGPQFIAVVDGPEDHSNVTFAVATHLVKFVRRMGEDGSIQATLSL
jgi:hypothetical protein